ncbi:MAG: hypothetical protein KR126chlam3_01700 [Chlamydiae bacterium]|nr:hypothetical protein [Chlamydiota bacterium]
MEDRTWIEKFLKDYFLTESTMFTLFGSKPMSAISLCYATKEEWLSGYSKLIQDYPEKKKQKALTGLERYIDNYDLPINWQRWMDWCFKNLDGSFSFSKRTTGTKDLFCIYVLNVQEAAWILQKHYSLISRELDLEFDPLQVVLEFEDLSSSFWEKVFNNHLVQGILHGFGERNAYFFDREIRLQEINDFDLEMHPLFKSLGLKQDQEGKILNDYPLPLFRSYSSNVQEDPVFLKYKRERAEIKKILGSKNPTDIILHQLGYQSTASKKEIAFN